MPPMPDPISDQKAMFKRFYEVSNPQRIWSNLGRVQTEGVKEYLADESADISITHAQGFLLIEVKRRNVPAGSTQQVVLAGVPKHGADPQSAPLVVADESRPLIERVEALQSWIAEENDQAARFVLDQLKSERTDTLWRAALVLATETIDFSHGDLRREATTVLQRVSLALRDERTPGIERAVYCAIARYASLVDPVDADEFCAFLDRDGYVDTRLAALKGIVHLFEMSPPEHGGQYARLRDRIVELAQKLLDRDVFASGQNSAIAKEALVATGTLGDARLLDLVGLAIQVKRDWFQRELRRRLDELRNLWTENGMDAKSEAFRQLESAIDSIKR